MRGQTHQIYKKCIWKDPNITNDIRRKSREKAESSRHVTGASRAVAQGDYTHRYSLTASIVRQALAVQCVLSQGPPVQRYKYEARSLLENP